jgi:hypothetical protein
MPPKTPLLAVGCALSFLSLVAAAAAAQPTVAKEKAAPVGDGGRMPVKVAEGYSTCKSWQEVVEGEDLRYAPVLRVSDPGMEDRPAYTGFWFYDGLQFDEPGRYALAMKVSVRERDVTPSDRREIGYIDLKDSNKWTKVVETTAWNWQQGCRPTWRGRSREILWNDRDDDGGRLARRAYDFKTGARRTLPRPIYTARTCGPSTRPSAITLGWTTTRSSKGATSRPTRTAARAGRIAWRTWAASISIRPSCPAAGGSSSTPTRSRATSTSSSSTGPAGPSCRWPS